jgi:hypothetical protein
VVVNLAVAVVAVLVLRGPAMPVSVLPLDLVVVETMEAETIKLPLVVPLVLLLAEGQSALH